MKQDWRKIPSYPKYEANSDGWIRNTWTKQALQQFENVDGYLMVALWQNSRALHRRVHRLVAEAFIGPNPFEGAEVNHIDGNKKNNRASNLEYTTKQENIDHAVREGLVKRGEEASSSKLTADDVREMRALHNEAQISIRDLSLMFEISPEAVVKIIKGRTWRHV